MSYIIPNSLMFSIYYILATVLPVTLRFWSRSNPVLVHLHDSPCEIPPSPNLFLYDHPKETQKLVKLINKSLEHLVETHDMSMIFQWFSYDRAISNLYRSSFPRPEPSDIAVTRALAVGQSSSRLGRFIPALGGIIHGIVQ